MQDKPFSGLPPNTNERKAEAMGVRMIGTIDPRTMTPEAFEQSPELLFHGASKAIDFSSEFDYRSEGYLTENDGSATLGFGFYTTNKKEEASNYSLVRQARADAPTVVMQVLPYQARVLDLRRKDNLSENAPVSKEFMTKWRERFLAHRKTKKAREGNLGAILDSFETEYAEYLNKMSSQSEIDLRTLLNTVRYPAPPWTLLFSDFMREEGYDGVIYNEGGEGQEGKGGASYVFYNLSKIGTYESWNKLG